MTDPAEPRRQPDGDWSVQPRGLVRSLGQVQAIAINMSNMVGAGPFITIPLIIAAMGGPQCMLGSDG